MEGKGNSIFPKKVNKIKFLLLTIILLNIYSLGCSFYFNNVIYNSNKLMNAPGNFLWEWLTIFGCVGTSILTIAYSVLEGKWVSGKNKKSRLRQSVFGLIMAVNNLIGMAIFAFSLPKLATSGVTKGPFWWTYAIIWHFISPPLSLFYFFRFAKIEEKIICQKRTFFWLSLQPLVFLIANLTRRILVEREFRKKPWKKLVISPINWIRKERYGAFTGFVIGSLFLFWLLALLLLGIKKNLLLSYQRKERRRNPFVFSQKLPF